MITVTDFNSRIINANLSGVPWAECRRAGSKPAVVEFATFDSRFSLSRPRPRASGLQWLKSKTESLVAMQVLTNSLQQNWDNVMFRLHGW